MAEQEVRKLVREITEQQGDILDGSYMEIMKSDMEIKKCHPEGSFSRLFWEEQIHAALAKDPAKFAGTQPLYAGA